MTKALTQSILLFFLIFISYSTYAQYLINEKLSFPYGNPSSEIDWSASELDMSGNIITTSHKVISGSEINVVTTKHSSNGNLLWEKEFSVGANSKNYGVALTTDAVGNSFIAAACSPAQSSTHDIVIIKYDDFGNEMWNIVYDGPGQGEDIPTAIINDGIGNIYFTGGSFGNNTQSDYVTIKMDNLGNIKWTERYDYAGLYDVPADIGLDQSGNVVVTGGSNSSMTSWDYATLSYDKTLGDQLNENRILSPIVGFNAPTAMVKDNQGSFFITGNIDSPATGYNIRTIKLDSDFNVQWTITYDRQGLDDKANSIAIDDNGNIVICGYTSKTNGGKDFLILKYDNNGNQLWDQHGKAPYANEVAKAEKIIFDPLGNILVTGEKQNHNNDFIFTAKYNQLGQKLWSKKYDLNTNAAEKITDLHLDSGGSVFVTIKNFNGSNWRYSIAKYWEYKRDKNVVYDSGNNPLYREDELIVRFNSDEVETANIDETGVVSAPLDFFLSKSAINRLNKKMPFKSTEAHLIRVFKQLKSTHQTSVTRLAESIPIPHFWATFVLVMPSGTNLQEVRDSLNTMHPIVLYNHPNYLAKTGESFVKLGVFDSG